jgi:hypothetical protein
MPHVMYGINLHLNSLLNERRIVYVRQKRVEGLIASAYLTAALVGTTVMCIWAQQPSCLDSRALECPRREAIEQNIANIDQPRNTRGNSHPP